MPQVYAILEVVDYLGGVCAFSHRVLLHSRLISRHMPNPERVGKRLRAALGALDELPQSVLVEALKWERCSLCGWPTNSPSTCSGRAGQSHCPALGHNLILHVEKGQTKTVLTVIDPDGLSVDLETLTYNCKQCWVKYGLGYRFEVKKETGEFVSKMEVVPQYGGPVFIAIDCRVNQNIPIKTLDAGTQCCAPLQYKGVKNVGWYHSPRIRLTGCPVLDEKLLPGGTRHDVLDHLKRTAKLRALDSSYSVSC